MTDPRIEEAKVFWGKKILSDATAFEALITQLIAAEDRAEIANFKLEAATKDAAAAEADRNLLRAMLDVMPEYLEYWINNNTFSDPALTLSEWFAEVYSRA